VILGLSYDTNETVLRDAFIQHGEIIEGMVTDCMEKILMMLRIK